MIKAIKSYDPDKPLIMKAFKEKFNATKVTSVKFNSNRNTFFATCFRGYEKLGLKEINSIQINGLQNKERKKMLLVCDKKEPTYDEAKKFIGGYIQSVPLTNGDKLLMDEEGRIKFLEPNFEAQEYWDKSYPGNKDLMVGKMILVKSNVNRGW